MFILSPDLGEICQSFCQTFNFGLAVTKSSEELLKGSNSNFSPIGVVEKVVSAIKFNFSYHIVSFR